MRPDTFGIYDGCIERTAAPVDELSNAHLSTEGRKLLHRLTASNSTITYNEEFKSWSMGGQELRGAKERAAKEILHLCAIQTQGKLFPLIRYELSAEGLRILLRKEYIPLIVQSRIRKP